MEQQVQAIVKEHLESEAFMAHVNQQVKVNFKEMVEIISKPFLIITVPVIVFAAFLLYTQLNGADDSISQLSKEISALSVAVARLEG